MQQIRLETVLFLPEPRQTDSRAQAGSMARRDKDLGPSRPSAIMKCLATFDSSEQVTADDARGMAVAISVPRSPQLHSLFDGRVLLRSAAKNRPLSGEEIRHLASAKGAGDFEQEAAAGATLPDLDEKLILEHAEKRRLRGPRG